ncbi:ABC transporter ATP-binding protein [Umezawaea endophytica]|uniref:ABC transporter ATP-binding protein n=1 Tax=Umezawaea endophytica TaxID=1654476 RepID=A0A9X2VM90_9PSEU|nr:ABC transporter ATP-binding protein [Umezawaea endophytica]MCS7478999.1 ABC transporter ATP-binding protein [Umezawaea endophytica]
MTQFDNHPVLAGRGLVKRYREVNALDGVDMTVWAGEVVAIVGPSGSGKSSLLHVLSGVLPADGGEVFLGGKPITTLGEADRSLLRRSAFGFVFQAGLLVAELTAEENAALPLLLSGVPRGDALAAAGEWLARLGLDGLERRRPGELSGGQAQRVAIARAMVHRPRVVFADEPTGALDSRTGQEVVTSLLHATRQTGAALIVVTHDRAVASRAQRVVEMRDGRVSSAAAA